MIESRQAYPLSWPSGWPRTNPHQRVSGRFDVSFARARDDLLDELRLMGAREPILSTNVPLRRDGLPYANGFGRISDPGVAVYFTWRKVPYAIACDKFSTVDHNLRAIGLTVASLRAIDRYGATGLLERAFRGFTAIAGPDVIDWRRELELPVNVAPTKESIDAAYRTLARRHHPDVGGTDERMARLTAARDRAMETIGAN